MKIDCYVDVLDGRRISGWAISRDDVRKTVRLGLYLDGRFQVVLFAHAPRSDLERLDHAAGRFAFQFDFTPSMRRRGSATLVLRDFDEPERELYRREVVFDPES